MDIVNQLFALAGVVYLALAIWFWRSRWIKTAASPPKATLFREKAAIVTALLLHALALKNALFSEGGMHFSFSLAFSFMVWLAALICWLENFRVRMDGLQPIVLSAGVLASLLPLVFPQTRAIIHADTLGFRLHFLFAMLAYSLFTLAAVHAVFMGMVEKRLHQHLFLGRIAPPLLEMESLLFRILTIAFSLLTLALCSGLFYSETLFGTLLPFEQKPFIHKLFFAAFSWVVFAILLGGRYIYGWRGKKALRWTLAGFSALFLAYIGSHFVLEVLLVSHPPAV